MTTDYVEDCFALSAKDVLQGHCQGRADVRIWLDDGDVANPDSVTICVGSNEPQTLNLVWEEITYGSRAYFLCECDHKSAKLYLPPRGSKFKCRKCHHLRYQISSYNRHSVAGKALHRMSRLRKLADKRASMSRILYRGKFSKRFEHYLRLCERAGFMSIVNGANDLRHLLQQ